MVKKTVFPLAVLVLALIAAPAAADNDFALSGAYWNTDDADEAMGVTGKVRFNILELRATYFSDVTADTTPERNDFEVKTIPLEAGLAFQFAEDAPVNPYVGGGAGYYLLDSDAGDIDDEVGYYGVVGANFGRMENIGFNVEAIYRNMEATVRTPPEQLDDEEPEIDENVDLQLGGIGVNFGVVWRF
jgi:outer membrane protein W